MQTDVRRSPGRRAPHRRHRLRHAALTWLALFAIWMLLVDSLAHPEVIAGLAAATLTLPVALGVSARVERRFHPRLRWLAELRQTPANVLRDSLLLGRALARHLTGREPMRGAFRLVPFTLPPGDDEQAAAWQAFAIAATSVTPNTYVIGIDAERGVALVHQLVVTPPDQARRAVIGATPMETDASVSGGRPRA